MPPVIMFSGASPANIYVNPGLAPSGPFLVGTPTSIIVGVSNISAVACGVIVHLWWIGPTLAPGDGPMLDLVNSSRLAPPFGPANPISFALAPATGQSVTVWWTPSAADFPKAVLGTSVPGCLFAQAEIQAAPPVYGGDTSALTCWSPAYSLCAQRTIHIST